MNLFASSQLYVQFNKHAVSRPTDTCSLCSTPHLWFAKPYLGPSSGNAVALNGSCSMCQSNSVSSSLASLLAPAASESASENVSYHILYSLQFNCINRLCHCLFSVTRPCQISYLWMCASQSTGIQQQHLLADYNHTTIIIIIIIILILGTTLVVLSSWHSICKSCNTEANALKWPETTNVTTVLMKKTASVVCTLPGVLC